MGHNGLCPDQRGQNKEMQTMDDAITNTDQTAAPVVQGVVMPYTVDDRGNVADFYKINESGEYHRVARLDREAGPKPNVDDVYTWDGDADVTAWAMQNGYRWEIRLANRLARIPMLEEALSEMLEMYGPPIAVVDMCDYPARHPITLAMLALGKA